MYLYLIKILVSISSVFVAKDRLNVSLFNKNSKLILNTLCLGYCLCPIGFLQFYVLKEFVNKN